MMNPLDKISQALGTETGLTYDAPKEVVIEDITATMKTVLRKNNGDDYQFVREQLKKAITEASLMLPGLVGLAKVAESPNLYNSASGFFDSFVKLNQALLENGMKMEKVVSAAGKVDAPVEPVKALPAPQEDGAPKPDGFAFEGTTEQLLDLVLRTKSTEPAHPPIDVESQFVTSK